MRSNTILECGKHLLDYGAKTHIMGILNATPDSFSDGGYFNHIDKAVAHAKTMVEHGADIIDIGGESTRPGSAVVSAEEELERVIPIIKAVGYHVDVPISIDTYKAVVAREAIGAGAHIINDVWGAKADPDMAQTAAELNVPIILMHNRKDHDYHFFIRDVLNDIYESIALCRDAGVKDEMIVLDPGIGFAKTVSQNLEMMRNLDKLTSTGYPVLLGTSRKSTIGKVLDLPVDERMEGTGATVCFGISQGCQFVRVHDVKEMSRMARMMDAMLGKGEYDG